MAETISGTAGVGGNECARRVGVDDDGLISTVATPTPPTTSRGGATVPIDGLENTRRIRFKKGIRNASADEAKETTRTIEVENFMMGAVGDGGGLDEANECKQASKQVVVVVVIVVVNGML
jgi:hypothetical protein